MALNKEAKQAIDNYGKKIKTLDDFVSAVRQIPAMYIGPLSDQGMLTMIREIFQNSVDQLILENSPCNHIYLFYDMRDHRVINEDNGLGLPFNDMVRIFTSEHTSKNYEKELGEYSSGRHGLGSKVVNALSTYFIAESYNYQGEARRLEMVEGYPTSKEPSKIPNPDCKQGTRIEFKPCYEIMGEINLDWQVVYKLVKIITSLTPIGSCVDFEAIDLNGNVHKEHIVNEDGIITDLIMKMRSPMIKPIVLSSDIGTMKCDLAFSYDADAMESGNTEPNITAFSNFCPTVGGGTHVNGFISGVTTWFTSYMNKIYLTDNRKKTKVIASDIKNGLNVMISAAHLEPLFTGQAKELLSNKDIEPFVKDLVIKGLDEWSKNNPQDLQKLCKYFKDLAEIRMKADKEKVKIATKYNASALTGYPAKYTRPEGKTNLELIICEGDSAAGSLKDGRDKKRQGVFPIRGKVANAFKKSYKELFSNAEIQGIVSIVLDRKPYTRNFDPIKDVKWEKIIFAADADIDGSHICALLLRFFIMYMPQLLEAGKVYRAVPPLYGVNKGKNKTDYFTDRIDIVRYIQKEFSKTNKISFNGKPLTSKELTILLTRNEDYLYEMNCIADRYSVDPELLELTLVNYLNNASPAALKKSIKSKYRFMDISNHEKYNTEVVEGIIGNNYNTLYLNDKLIAECKNIIDIIKDNDQVYYTLNGEEVSLYRIMTEYEKSSPKNIQRFKGLGEMSYQKLAESTIHPDGNRTLIRYTLEDAKEELEAIREYESDMKKILSHIGSVSRSELMGI